MSKFPIVVALDGIDYSGKSTVVTQLSERFKAGGCSVVVQPFPSKCGKGAEARKLLVSPNYDPNVVARLMIENMSDVLDDLKDLDVDFVIFDRFAITTAACQGVENASLPLFDTRLMCHELAPKYHFVLSVNYDVATARAKERGKCWDDSFTEDKFASEFSWNKHLLDYQCAIKYMRSLTDAHIELIEDPLNSNSVVEQILATL